MVRERKPVRIGRSPDFPVGEIRIVKLDAREIGVIRLLSGRLRAVMNRCPHKGAPICRGIVGGVWASKGPGELSLDADRSVLVCPWHGFEFDLETGKEVLWRRPSSLRMYAIEEVGGEVIVTV
jgi:3-phenylpropionate/trans-cinnamate dioxygenase ferredoxin subunit